MDKKKWATAGKGQDWLEHRKNIGALTTLPAEIGFSQNLAKSRSQAATLTIKVSQADDLFCCCRCAKLSHHGLHDPPAPYSILVLTFCALLWSTPLVPLIFAWPTSTLIVSQGLMAAACPRPICPLHLLMPPESWQLS